MSENKKYAVFTIDVEAFSDTGCISALGKNVCSDADARLMDGLERYLSLLEWHGIRATMFALASTAKKLGDRLREYVCRGHEPALHGLNHTSLDSMDSGRFREETLAAKELLEKELGTDICGYRAPFFSLDNEKLEILKELGFSYDSSRMAYPGSDHNGKLDVSGFDKVLCEAYRSGDFFEYGISHKKLFGMNVPISGGGYIRLSGPGWGAVRSMIESYAKAEDLYIFYLHPFELSQNTPPCPRELAAHDKYYLRHGLRDYGAKIETIIDILKRHGFEFVTFDDLTRKLKQKCGTPTAPTCTDSSI